MASTASNFACYVTIIFLCIGPGDGRWKQKDREKLERDIAQFRKIADNIEYEIEEFYDDYESSDENKLSQYISPTSKVSHTEIGEFNNIEGKSPQRNESHFPWMENAIMENYNNDRTSLPLTYVQFKSKPSKTNTITLNNKQPWPKFDDILLDIGKKYDWKTDRWIKVKKKIKNDNITADDNKNRLNISMRHHFYYRTIKLNRSKSKRNVIIAVKAVR